MKRREERKSGLEEASQGHEAQQRMRKVSWGSFSRAWRAGMNEKSVLGKLQGHEEQEWMRKVS
ncbi:hypothetical protein ACOJQI_06625 [Bacillus salacetis]|uniref:hypothetical protein n=1 Tax=Bacillus salacetis TaxID=2315464 RepID=UPI003BA261BA